MKKVLFGLCAAAVLVLSACSSNGVKVNPMGQPDGHPVAVSQDSGSTSSTSSFDHALHQMH